MTTKYDDCTHARKWLPLNSMTVIILLSCSNSADVSEWEFLLLLLLCVCLCRCFCPRGHKVWGDWQLPVAQLPHHDRVRACGSVFPGADLLPWKWGSVIAFSSSSFLLTRVFVFCSSSPPNHVFFIPFFALYRALSCYTFSILTFWVSLIATYASSQLMKDWVMCQSTLNYRMLEQFCLSFNIYHQ